MSKPQPLSEFVQRMQRALDAFTAASDEGSRMLALSAMTRAMRDQRIGQPPEPHDYKLAQAKDGE